MDLVGPNDVRANIPTNFGKSRDQTMSQPEDEVAIERRNQQRVAVEVGVTMTSDSNLFVGLTDNISEGGLFVATHELLPVGSELDLEFQLPEDDEPISVRAQVRWHRPVSQASADRMPGFGARFVDLDDSDRERLEDFVDSREPMFHPA